MGMAEPGESIELTCLIALREARAAFINEIVLHGRNHAAAANNSKNELTKEDIDLLRDEGYHIAEFYYLVEQYKLADRTKIRLFLERHNEDMEEYASNKEKRDLLGLSKARVEEALFSDTQIEKVVQNISDGKLRLDQTDLGRLLGTLRSPETTRKAVVALSKAGLLNRINIGQVIVVSTGALEKYFEAHLQRIVRMLSENRQLAEEYRS
jgi:hypothetical protein